MRRERVDSKRHRLSPDRFPKLDFSSATRTAVAGNVLNRCHRHLRSTCCVCADYGSFPLFLCTNNNNNNNRRVEIGQARSTHCCRGRGCTSLPRAVMVTASVAFDSTKLTLPCKINSTTHVVCCATSTAPGSRVTDGQTARRQASAARCLPLRLVDSYAFLQSRRSFFFSDLFIYSRAVHTDHLSTLDTHRWTEGGYC